MKMDNNNKNEKYLSPHTGSNNINIYICSRDVLRDEKWRMIKKKKKKLEARQKKKHKKEWKLLISVAYIRYTYDHYIGRPHSNG